MNVLFDEDGGFKAGQVLQDAGASLQVELPTGRRVKVKSSHVVLRFPAPAADQLLRDAQAMADEIDLDLVWETAPEGEFGFEDVAAEWFGHAPAPTEAAALLLRLHGSPVHFHRKGRGRFRAAPADILKAALAAVERKRQQQLQVDEWARRMAAGELPDEVRAQADALAFAPDKNTIEWKALDAACALAHRAPERLLFELGAFESPRALHLRRFRHEHFPRGFGFERAGLDEAAVAAAVAAGDARVAALPLAEFDGTLVQAFSVDDSTTTEIDDALSVTPLADGRLRVGVHIAAPALGIVPGSPFDAVARARMSTVYMPGDKVTMLPQAAVERWSLDAGDEPRPALSLYVDLEADGVTVASSFSRAERVRIAANLRHDALDAAVSEAALDDEAAPLPGIEGFEAALRALWRFAQGLTAERERVRGKPEPRNRADFSFYVDRDAEGAERVRIVQRRRDAPLDRIVAELMILANSRWGRLLADRKVPGIYRVQPPMGRVRMTTHGAPHAGMGVSHYAWSSSPLRRYVDLVNQRQVLAVLAEEPAPFAEGDADLFAVIGAFDAKYAAYGDFQSRMERWWCLRWLAQEGLERVQAVVIRDDLVRLVEAPLFLRPTGMPELAPGRHVVIDLLERDELELTVSARFVEVAGELVDEIVDELAEDAEGAAAEAAEAEGAPEVPAALPEGIPGAGVDGVGAGAGAETAGAAAAVAEDTLPGAGA